MAAQVQSIPSEKFQEIYTNPLIAKAIAYPCHCCDEGGKFKHFETVIYPVRYIVSLEQVAEARKQYKAFKLGLLASIRADRDTFVLAGYGSQFETNQADSLGNHRLRAEFINSKGHRFFIEVSTHRDVTQMIVTHAVDREQEAIYRSLIRERREKEVASGEHYKGLTRNYSGGYTKQNFLNLINKHFDCQFKSVRVLHDHVSTDDFMNVCPSLPINVRVWNMFTSWQEEGRAWSKVANDDGIFFKLINTPIDEVGITSQTGNDVIYYNTDLFDSDESAIKNRRKAVKLDNPLLVDVMKG